jgi:hypothetical protein
MTASNASFSVSFTLRPLLIPPLEIDTETELLRPLGGWRAGTGKTPALPRGTPVTDLEPTDCCCWYAWSREPRSQTAVKKHANSVFS